MKVTGTGNAGVDQMPSYSQAEIIQQLFIDGGIGSAPPTDGTEPTDPWPVYSAGWPGSPDSAILITDTTGTDDGRSMTDGEVLGLAGFQVLIRAPTHRSGRDKAQEVFDWMSQSVYREAVTIDGEPHTVHTISKIGDILYLGKEAPSSRRTMMSINAVTYIT